MRSQLLALAAFTLLVVGCGGSNSSSSSSTGGSSTSTTTTSTTTAGSTSGSAGSSGAASTGSTSGSSGSASTTSSGSGSTGASNGSGSTSGSTGSTAFKVRGSVAEVMVWMAPPSTQLELHDAQNNVSQTGVADSQGSLIWRQVPEGDYTVVAPNLTPAETEGPVHVSTVADSLPAQSFYSSQSLTKGFTYITTRDGTQLSAYITFPAGPGPYPTVVNYSGYSPSQPGQPLGNFGTLCNDLPVLCDAPNDPSAEIAALMGYATVGVNMRGTGCSGGAYDYFEDLQLTDGYDIIEAVAAQPWVLNGKVGMTGISYPGITQLFVAKMHPPHLAAITPLSVIGGTYSTARPGGIFNDGFALEWISSVVDKADPYGQGWEQGQVNAGDTVCAENQLLHSQKVNVIAEAQSEAYYTDALVGRVDPTKFVDQIQVPVFLACSQEDEQTGPFFFTLLDKFTGSPLTRFTVYNGVHIDGFAPQVMVEWKAFLDIYVAQQVPVISSEVRTLAPTLFQQVFKEQMQLPPDRFANYPDWASAKTAYEAEQPLRAIFENGDGDTANPGSPVGTFEMHFDAWPPSNTTTTRFYFQPDGTMADTAPAVVDGGAPGATFLLDPDAGHRGILADGGDVWDPLPAYDWKEPPAGYDVVFETAPLASDLVMLGTASADLWVRSPVDDADLEVNLTEVRPDGQEMFVQTGWLRASLRALDPSATDLWPEHTYTQADEQLLTPGDWVQARVGIPSFNHVFRAGSKIRVLVDTPGDSRAAWTFALKSFPGSVSYDIGASAAYPSSIALPVLTGVSATTPLPPCPSLRGKQCRDYQPYTNTPSAP
ncbi:MAG: CocE/NonD family hydrolase [Deltaproteobacteria bacterium]|nr:CocE/NonD family hydrolase [Deltaproteobacteria bacterium]